LGSTVTQVSDQGCLSDALAASKGTRKLCRSEAERAILWSTRRGCPPLPSVLVRASRGLYARGLGRLLLLEETAASWYESHIPVSMMQVRTDKAWLATNSASHGGSTDGDARVPRRALFTPAGLASSPIQEDQLDILNTGPRDGSGSEELLYGWD
jgi:hypothetical protein